MSDSSNVVTITINHEIERVLDMLTNRHMGCSEAVAQSFAGESLKPFIYLITRSAVELGIPFHIVSGNAEEVCFQFHRQMSELEYDPYDQTVLRDVVFYHLAFSLIDRLRDLGVPVVGLKSVRYMDQTVRIHDKRIETIVSFSMEFDDDRRGLEEGTGV